MLTGKTNEERIWSFLKGEGLNDFGAAGMMGNLYAESGLIPTNLQNSYEKKLDYTDQTYTEAVDCGTYAGFADDAAGYGIAQWTYPTRKRNLLCYARGANRSIGDLEMQLEFLMKELRESYKAVLTVLKTAGSIQEASDAVLVKFERPADQSSTAKAKRAAYGQKFYDTYADNTREFKPRLTRPEAGNKYYMTKSSGGYSDAIKGKPVDSACDVLSNCVGYAYGRFNEIGGYGCCKYLRPVNAENFIQFAEGLKVGLTPELGACMVWRKGATLNAYDGAGHVAIVEQIISDTEIVTSESGYGNLKPFWTKKRKKGTGNWGAGIGYTFIGFIYNPAVKGRPAATLTVQAGTNAAESTGTLKVGDRVKMDKTATIYGTLKRFTAWVYAAKLYVRSVSGDRVVVSTMKTGAVTGAVDKKHLTKV